MLSRRNGLQSLPGLSVLVYLLLQTHSCKGQSEVIAPSQPIVAKVGDDIILPCHVEPALDVVSLTLEWTKPNLNPMFVHVRLGGQELIHTKHPSYKGRTSVSIDELKNGNVSLKLSKLKPSDAGRYECYIPKLKIGASVELVVGAASSPSISLSRLDRNKGGVVLQCVSTSWYPEPEVFWLDGEGNLLSAGPTETVRGPDDLYTISSRVTVEKRHSRITCRVQQNHINQIREAHIHISDDFFEVQSSSSSTTVGLAVSLAVCILVILILGFLVWKLTINRSSKCQKTQADGATGEQIEGQQLLTHETVQMKDLNKGREERKTESSKWPLVTRKRFKEEKNMLKEEKKRREEAEGEVQRKNQELQEKTDQIGNKDETIKKLQQEKQDKETEITEEKKTLQAKNQQVVSLTADNNKLTEEKTESEKERQKLQTKITEPEEHKAADRQSMRTSESDGGSSSPEPQDEKKQNSSSLSQNSTTGPAVDFKVDTKGEYIQLRNTSTQDQQLGGWVLKIQVNKEEPIKHTFEDSFNLKAEHVFTVGCCGYVMNDPRAQLVLKDLKPWSYTDTVQVSLIRHPGEIQYILNRIN